MSTVKMSKIRLMGVNSHKEKILDALYRTGQVELSETEEFTDTFRLPLTEDIAVIGNRYERLGRVIDFYVEVIERSKNKVYYPKSDYLYKNLSVSYEEFMRSAEKTDFIDSELRLAEEFKGELSDFRAERAKLLNINSGLLPYLKIEDNLSAFKDTEITKTFFGTVKKDAANVIKEKLSDVAEVCFSVVFAEQTAVICLTAHNCVESKVSEILAENEFSACPYSFDCTARQKTEENNGKIAELNDKEESVYKEICERSNVIKDLKIVYDYYGLVLEKEREKENFSCTSSTFILEGFIPSCKAEEIENAVRLVSDAVFIEISDPNKDDVVPTLLKNNFAVKQTEFITDMYSTPNYKERDPNRAVFFFFMLFMGVIMADIGYGVIMIAIGLALAGKIKTDNGTRRLWYNIAFGGIFAVIFGILFNSLFGISVLNFTLLPSPVPSEGGQTGLMTILLGCLALGVIQIAFGYFMKALNLFNSGDIAGGIFDGICWVLFFIGFVFAAFNFLINYLMPTAYATMNESVKRFFTVMTTPGLILMLASLFVAATTAGRKEKGFGKLSKGFGTVYGLINIFSDILSYARLFGLMLSGMIIAKTFNDIGAGLFAGGAVGYLFGGAVIFIGHTFNLAMGVLGAYIHDSRLQYIEFFGKFYTGEGSKFKPIGSDLKYINVIK